MRVYLVDVFNRIKGSFEGGKYDSLPVPGANLASTIDIDLQILGEKLGLFSRDILNAILTGESKTNKYLRISVESGGCSGMNYNLTFDDQKNEFDKIYKSNGITILCDIKSWLYVKGTEIDFSDDMLSGGFKLNNPNANRTCGCGTSFSA